MDPSNQYQEQFEKGTRVFQKLFTAWMDGNNWSHPVMTSLVRSSLDGASWFHSSQISGLRQRKLFSPGPRIFLGIERLNYFVWRYQTEGTLIPNTTSSNHYANATPVLEEGEPPSVGWWVEVFLGTRMPLDFDLTAHHFSEEQAEKLSRNFGRLIRRLCARKEIDLIDDLRRTIREHYPAGDDHRISRLKGVICGESTWSPAELELELSALVMLADGLEGPSTEKALLERIR
ncbi:hypothetical protein [Vulcanococcus limneticus]|uniref:hypothetical protein n=1 Tax=Vulcanococcus limneticus TaxID=2170428 RepID=UPI0012FF9823|nr:hypothetical protein [Vulcanococcus limneticus]MCP9791498.1 hypothetical protein [Vulcanococcus limneticus MW73D5]MCP9898889.1 hypothetical protein [Vulcanococcus limneticus Candia 3B3]